MAGAVQLNALRSRQSTQVTPAKATHVVAECLRCHSDKKTIDRMRDKEDGGNYLFNSDGTFKENINLANFQHKKPVNFNESKKSDSPIQSQSIK